MAFSSMTPFCNKSFTNQLSNRQRSNKQNGHWPWLKNSKQNSLEKEVVVSSLGSFITLYQFQNCFSIPGYESIVKHKMYSMNPEAHGPQDWRCEAVPRQEQTPQPQGPCSSSDPIPVLVLCYGLTSKTAEMREAMFINLFWTVLIGCMILLVDERIHL